MHSPNIWGSTFEIQAERKTEDEESQNMDLDRAALLREQLDETQQGWLLGPQGEKEKEKHVDLGCIICKQKIFKWVLLSLLAGFIVIGIPIIIVKNLPKHTKPVPPPDEYTVALHKALLFFNAQRSGRLPKNNGISWRGDSCLHDGSTLTDVKGGLVGGYYDAGDNIKFHFPMAFSMALLSWSVIEYGHKYKAVGEYDHVRDIIKWGTDYLLQTFNSSATSITKIYSQVGIARNGSTSPDDEHYCWQRPEDIDYNRQVQTSTSAPDLGAEVAAALASASIVFQDEVAYSKKLVKAAATAFKFATDPGQRSSYSQGNDAVAPFYNSTSFWDEFIWGATWMFYATGNYTYISQATDPELPKNANAFSNIPDLSVFSWDNKLPAAELLLTRFRIFLNPGYPYEEVLKRYHDTSTQNMCFLLKQFHFFNWTHGGLIQLNHGQPQPLQYTVKAAFLASLYADYMNASHTPGLYCGSNFIPSSSLRQFATSQVPPMPSNGQAPAAPAYVVAHRPRTEPNNRGGVKKASKTTKIVQSAYCGVCKIDCTTQEVLSSHKQGKKHKKNLQKLQEAITPRPQKTQAKTKPADSKAVPVADKGDTGSSKQRKRKEAQSADLETKKKRVLEGGAEPNQVMVCSICNVVVNSQTVYDSHITGSKHAAMLKKQQEAAAS